MSIKRGHGWCCACAGGMGKGRGGWELIPKVSVGRYHWARPPPHSPEQVSVDVSGHPDYHKQTTTPDTNSISKQPLFQVFKRILTRFRKQVKRVGLRTRQAINKRPTPMGPATVQPAPTHIPLLYIPVAALSLYIDLKTTPTNLKHPPSRERIL